MPPPAVLAPLMAVTSAPVLQPTLKLAGDAEATTGAATINPTTDTLVPTATLANVESFIRLPFKFAPLLPSGPYPAVPSGVKSPALGPTPRVVQDYVAEIEGNREWLRAH